MINNARKTNENKHEMILRMKQLRNKLLLGFILVCLQSCAQKQSFDITSFSAPKGWKKQASANAVQFSIEDAAKGSYCMITLMKSLTSPGNAKSNFDAAWETVVKETVNVSSEPTMQEPVKEAGWEAYSGYAPFEAEESKGVALLVTSTGFEKMVNILVLTNSDTYEKEVTAFLESVDFGKQAPGSNKPVKNTSNTNEPTTVAKKDGFTFTTSNFDDGWTSTVQEDWVEVVKGNIKVLIHYPNKLADEYNPNLLNGLKNAWDVLVAPRYSNATNFEFKPISGWQSIEFAEADCVERSSGKTVHIVLFKYNYSGGNGKYMEFITPDKSTYENEFGPYRQDTYGWEKVERMINYNKFAVAAADLKGKWSSNFSAFTQYVNAYTGANAGTNTYGSNETFEFMPGNNYKWSMGVASGAVGNLKFQSAKSAGKFSVPNNWQLNFTDIDGKPKNYPVYFSCIKGARILWIGEKAYGKE
jgi:hypothetical protein